MYAVFPLNIVVLPNESVALHLFEPRYKQLYEDFKNGKDFAIVFSGKDGLSSYGTLVRIDKVINEFPDGTVDLIVKGRKVIKVTAFHKLFPKKLYSGIEAEESCLGCEVSEELENLSSLYLQSIDKNKGVSDSENIFQLANRLELSQENKDELLHLNSNEELNNFLLNEIKFLFKIREQENNLNHNFQLN